MADNRRGAGGRVAGVLESSTRLEPGSDNEPIEPTQEGRAGATVAAPKRSKPDRSAKRIKARTVYIHDDLWERVIVQSHRKGMTFSDYIADRLERTVPDHRIVRADSSATDAA